jgi:lipoate-protein ligase A
VSLPCPFRLIRSGAGHPAWNMAVDDALLELFQPGDVPIFRLYGWSPAALSLGRFQPSGEVSLPAGAVLVRRPSGGAAIHHREDEVTYSLVADYERFGRKPRLAYEAVHAVVYTALESLGVPLASREREDEAAQRHGRCYANATGYDLVAGEAKLVGSAQRRLRRAFLQHGSIPLSPDPEVVGSTSLGQLLGRPPVRNEVEAALVQALLASLASEVRHDALRGTELHRASALERTRYAQSAWTHSL